MCRPPNHTTVITANRNESNHDVSHDRRSHTHQNQKCKQASKLHSIIESGQHHELHPLNQNTHAQHTRHHLPPSPPPTPITINNTSNHKTDNNQSSQNQKLVEYKVYFTAVVVPHTQARSEARAAPGPPPHALTNGRHPLSP